MTKYSHEKNATGATATLRMKMQQITKKLQKSNSKTFMKLE